jgi:hypothetical protein
MPILFFLKQYQEVLLILLQKIYLKNPFVLINGIFYPPGEPISPHQLHCGLFAAVNCSFTGHFFADAAISTRE